LAQGIWPPANTSSHSVPARREEFHNMGSKAELVDQVKALQRSDPGAKQVWWDFCEQSLGGVKDPNRHDANVLEDWLVDYQREKAAARPPSGGKGKGRPPVHVKPPVRYEAPVRYERERAPAAAPPPTWSHYAPPPAAPYGYGPPAHAHAPPAAAPPSLPDFVKLGQRTSGHWKSAWQTYCAIYGNGFNDPAKHDDTFIRGFLDYVGELATDGLTGLAAQQGIDLSAPPGPGGNKRPHGGERQPPAKRPATGPPPSREQAFDDGDEAKQALVDAIKALQRTDPEAKAAWWTFCDAELKGIKDPNRHDIAALEQFLATYE